MPLSTLSESDICAALEAMVAQAASKKLVVNGRIACPKASIPERETPNPFSAD
jgi:hypothetical protein